MNVNGKHYRTIWLKDKSTVSIIDQRWLPHRFIIEDLHTSDEVIIAIKEMRLRGAGLIGAAAGYGMYLSVIEAAGKASFDDYLFESAKAFISSRPTAVNLEWAVNRQLQAIAKGRST